MCYTEHMTNTALIKRLEEEIAKAGSLRKWAAAHDIEPGIVSKSVRAPLMYPTVASALGYERTEEVWQPVAKEKKNELSS
jgi:hypothetical protein